MEVKLIISADDKAMQFAKLLGGLFQEDITISSDAKAEPITEETLVTLGTAPVDEPEIIKEDIITNSPVYTAEELRAVALQIPKEADKQQEVARILQSACAPDTKPSISNILPENSYQAMVRLKTLAGIE